MKLGLVLVAVIIGSVYSANQEFNGHWRRFKQVYHKNYNDVHEESYRRQVFEENVRKIAEHNVQNDLGSKSFRLALNKFGDLTNKEFVALYNGLRLSGNRKPAPHHHQVTGEELPTEVDWRNKGIVTPVKNQAQCGSCWAFATVAALEGQHARATGKLVSLSEQNLVDCSGPEGNNGCEGGLPDYGYQYIIDNGGIDTESSYPYEAIDDNCRYKKANRGAGVNSFTDVAQGDENALQSAVSSVGPVSVGIDASNESFQFYSSGVYSEPNCSTEQLDHGVTVVGYGSENGQDYWLVKNSWGDSWGEAGYIKMSRNSGNQCGIASMASYPNV